MAEAYRLFTLDPYRGGMLTSPGHQHQGRGVRFEGAVLRAVCTRHPEHVPPDPGCYCGIHVGGSVKALCALSLMWHLTDRVYATVQPIGPPVPDRRVRAGPGWAARYTAATLTALWWPVERHCAVCARLHQRTGWPIPSQATLDALADRYRVPVVGPFGRLGGTGGGSARLPAETG